MSRWETRPGFGHKVLVTDIWSRPWGYTIGAIADYLDGPENNHFNVVNWHNGGANLLYFDGHVGWMKREELWYKKYNLITHYWNPSYPF